MLLLSKCISAPECTCLPPDKTLSVNPQVLTGHPQETRHAKPQLQQQDASKSAHTTIERNKKQCQQLSRSKYWGPAPTSRIGSFSCAAFMASEACGVTVRPSRTKPCRKSRQSELGCWGKRQTRVEVPWGWYLLPRPIILAFSFLKAFLLKVLCKLSFLQNYPERVAKNSTYNLRFAKFSRIDSTVTDLGRIQDFTQT